MLPMCSEFSRPTRRQVFLGHFRAPPQYSGEWRCDTHPRHSCDGRLVVIGYTPHHSFKLLEEVRETVRLVEGIGDDGALRPEPMARGSEKYR